MDEPEQLSLFDAKQYETAAPAAEILCGFMVVINKDGGSQVVLDPDQKFQAQRPATPSDVYPALSNIVADWQAMKTAEAVVSFQTQLARQATAQLKAQQQQEMDKARLGA